MPVIGARIRERRMALGLSQQQLAEPGLTRAFISLVEKEKAQPSRATLELIAKRLGKPPEYFLSDERDGELEALQLLDKTARHHASEKRWSEAIQHGTSALRIAARLGRPDLEISTQMHLAYCYLFDHQYEQALELYEQLLDLCREQNDRATLAEVHFRLGTTYQMMEDFFHARRNYQRAAMLSEEKKSQSELRANALVGLGACQSILGQLPESIQAYEAAMRSILPSEYHLCTRLPGSQPMLPTNGKLGGQPSIRSKG